MYRQFNWAVRGTSTLATSNSSRRLSYSSSFDWGPPSPSNNAYKSDTPKEIEANLRNNKSHTPPISNTTHTNPFIFYNEHLNEELSLTIPIDEILVQKRTAFQDIKIFKTKDFGKCLISDNHMQSAESDECVYHESLVHPALLSHPNPQTVFIGGGGELATAREILKHKSVKKVVMVDIDKEAVEICVEKLPEWNECVMDDIRLELIYGDADAYLKTCGIKFDVIIMDICDPTECGPGWKLYTKEFYQRVKSENMMDEYSIFCTQSTGASVNLIIECFSVINYTLRSVFNNVQPFKCDIPSFGCPWGFHICSDASDYILNKNSNPDMIDKEIKSENRLGEWGERTLRHYDGSCHLHMFNLSKFEREACEDESRVFTLDSPAFML